MPNRNSRRLTPVFGVLCHTRVTPGAERYGSTRYQRRSIAMLPPGSPALDREQALELLEQFQAALLELRKLRTQRGVQ